MAMSRHRLFLILAVLFFSGSCKKYPEGPTVSLRYRSERLSNIWKLASYLQAGTDKTTDYEATHRNYIWRFGQGGSYEFYGVLNGKNSSEAGEWKFANNDKDILLIPQASTDTIIYSIRMLKEKELRLTHDAGSFIEEWQLVPNTTK